MCFFFKKKVNQKHNKATAGWENGWTKCRAWLYEVYQCFIMKIYDFLQSFHLQGTYICNSKKGSIIKDITKALKEATPENSLGFCAVKVTWANQ